MGSQPLTRLIEVVSAGFGRAWNPIDVVLTAAAESKRAEIVAEGDAKAALIRARGDADVQAFCTQKQLELAQRAGDRLRAQEIRRQENLEAIATEAIEYLPSGDSERPVDQDWIASFFDFAKDVGDADVRTIWAHLLASEVGNPGSVARRTLRVLQVLSPAEAALFSKVAGLALTGSGFSFVICGLTGDEPLGISYSEWLAMIGCDLLFPNPSALAPESHDRILDTADGGQIVIEGTGGLPINCVMLTSAGLDLARAVPAVPPPNHAETVANIIRTRAWAVDVHATLR